MNEHHYPVLLKEACDALSLIPDGIYVDGTFGRGGHSREILSRLGSSGRLFALDRDPQAVAEGKKWSDARFRIDHGRFSQLPNFLELWKINHIHGVLLDLGLSTPQIKQAQRGMSFLLDGPLDMRMDPTQGITAAEWLAAATWQHITEVLKNYGEERFAAKVAKAIVAERAQSPITTTSQLVKIVERTVPTRTTGQHSATRCFQALRIYVNAELEELAQCLPACARALRQGGRLAVISFHPLEDQIVKRFLRPPPPPPAREFPMAEALISENGLRPVGRAIKPSESEVFANVQARSAILRVGEKVSL